VVLDLVVQPTHEHRDRRSAADVALIRTWRRRKSSFNLGETSGMPMWLGARMTSPCRAPTSKYVCNRAIRGELTEMRAALQRFATDTTCNDTRQADGEPHGVLSSVVRLWPLQIVQIARAEDPVAAIAVRRHYPCELDNLVPTRSESQPTLCLRETA
jgi:hypothetical protein